MADTSLGAYGVSAPSLKAYEPSWTDKLARALQWAGLPDQTVEGLTGSRGIGRTNRNMGMGLFDFTPIGIPLAVNEAQRSAEGGDWTGATLNAMAMIPGAKAGQKAIEAGVNEVKQGIRAYHGSPHDFDRFDISKIGTGEGAQAYGHGLYFAENEGVAKEYRKNLTQSRIASAKRSLAKTGGDVDAAIAAARAEIERLKALPNAGGDVGRRDALIRLQEEKLAEFNLLKNSGEMSPGRTYEVSINAHPDEFLDWDKPLSEQPELLRRLSLSKRKVIQELLQNDMFRDVSKPMQSYGQDLGPVTGEQLIKSLSLALEGKTVGGKSAEALRAAGIKGIRYKDAGSRGDKAGGTHNYVVFDDKIIDILRKYGIAGLTAGGIGGAALMGQPGQAQAADGLYGVR